MFDSTLEFKFSHYDYLHYFFWWTLGRESLHICYHTGTDIQICRQQLSGNSGYL
jgi:hypothetical protein